MSSRDLRLQLLMDTIDKSSAPLKKITGASSKAAQALKASRDQLKQLQGQQRKLTSFKKLQSATDDSAEKLAKAKLRAEELAKQFHNTERPSKTLTTRFKQATASAQRLKKAHYANREQLHQLNNQLKASGVNTKYLSRYQAKYARSINTTTEAIDKQKNQLAKLAEQQKRQRRMAAKLTSVRNGGLATGAAGAAATYGGQRLLGGMAGLMTPGIDFATTMSKVQALTRLDKDSDQFKALREQAKHLGRSTTFTATEAGQGQGLLAMAGFTPQAIKDAMPGMLALAKAAGEELGSTADIGSNILTGFDLQADQMGRLGDVLTGTFTRSNTTLAMLGETMGYVGPVASDLGSDLEEAAALAGKLGDAGIQGSRAGTSLRTIYSRLAAPPKAAADALESLSIQTKDASGNLRPMAQLLADLDKQTKNLGDTDRAALFKDIAGDEAFSALAVLARQAGSGELQTLIKTLRSAQGESTTAAKVMSDNAGGDIAALSSAWADVNIQLEETNNSPIRELIQNTTDMVRSIGQWTRDNPELTASLIKWAAILAGLVTVLGVIGIAVGGAMLGISALGSVLPVVIGGFKLLFAVLLANPIGLIVTAITAAAALIYYNWDSIATFFTGLWAEVTAAFDGGLLGVLKLITNWSPLGILYQVIQNALATLGIDIPDRFTDFGSMMIDGMINGITNKLNALKDTVLGAASSASNWFKEKLGIRSPSRVFTQHGSDVMAGLQKGLGQNKKTLTPMMGITKRLKQAGAGIALSAVAMNAPALDNRPPIKAAGPANSGAGLHIGEINIHAAPGMDEQALAQLVTRKIMELQGQQAASNRSRLSDED